MAFTPAPRGFRQATVQDVRDYALANDLPAGGSRGRLPLSTIEAFNAAHRKGKGRAFYGGTQHVREYVARGPKGGVQASVTEKPSVVRAWAAIEGIPVSARGRLSAEVHEAFARANA